ncbi:MAG: hypothetical protein JXM73_24915 [Anaerolineae bacterium]|nr:hypothetical protein [Anaerolineae bacterium]
MKRKLHVLVVACLILFSLVMCDISGSAPEVIDKGKEATEFLKQAKEELEPYAKQMAEDGIDWLKYAGKYADCLADHKSPSECQDEVTRAALQECLDKGKGIDYCTKRYH